MSPVRRVAVLGGCHRDVVARTDARFEPGTSCPGLAVERPGGVARNVAALLASAGLSVAFAGRVGRDAAGDGLLAGLAAAGVDVSAVGRDDDHPTGTYLAVHDADGELVAAVASMRIYDALTPETLAFEEIDGADLVFADANLPAATLDRLGARYGARLAVDAISRAKGGRILGALRAGALGFLNRTTAEALIGRASGNPADAAAGVAALGVTRAVVTAGPAPVVVIDGGRVAEIAVPARPVVDVTGAGDALIAGTLAALSGGAPLAAAVAVGIRAAGAALASVGSLDRLPADVLQAIRSPSFECIP